MLRRYKPHFYYAINRIMMQMLALVSPRIWESGDKMNSSEQLPYQKEL